MFSPPPPSSRSKPCSLPSVIHYIFDMAQQVHYPSDPLQSVAESLGYVAKPSQGRSTISLMKRLTREKGRTALSACHTISLRSTTWERQWCICMLTTVLAKTRIIQCCIILLVGDGWAPSANHSLFSSSWAHQFSSEQCFGLLKQRFRQTRVGCLADPEQVVNISARGYSRSAGWHPVGRCCCPDLQLDVNVSRPTQRCMWRRTQLHAETNAFACERKTRIHYTLNLSSTIVDEP